MKPAEAVATLQAFERTARNRADLLAALSIARSDSIDELLEKKQRKAAEQTAKRAFDNAERAVKLDPRNADAHLALSIACGKMTDFVSNAEKMALSRRIRDEALRTLALNPREDLAHHILGRWNYGIATLNPVLKLAARMVYGALPPASVEEAVKHLGAAASLKPERIMHHHQLALIYQDLKEREKAAAQWKMILELPSMDNDDEIAKSQARAALRLR